MISAILADSNFQSSDIETRWNQEKSRTDKKLP